MKATWEMKKLGEICEIIAGQAPPSKYYNDEGKGIPFLTVNSFGNIYPRVERWTTKCLRESKEGDVLFSVAGSLGLVNLGINACITRSIFALRPYKDLILQKFLFYTLKKYGAQIALMGSGTAQKVITINQISEFEILLPPLPIQQKIVKILDTIQEAIDIQEKIIEKTKKLKKSLMAELFKYGGPSFRKGRKLKKTEIGEIPEDWEVVRLGEVALDFLGGGTPSTNVREYWDGEIPWTTSSIIEEGKVCILKNGQRYITQLGYENSSTKIVPAFNLLVGTRVGVGKVAINEIDIAINQDLTGIIINREKINLFYLAYTLTSPRCQAFFNNYKRGATIKGIPRSDLETMLIPLPPLSEQQEIAEILQTIDQKIEIEKRKKELYEELFKTMLNKIMSQEIDVEKIEV
jgi:type I restriction enzyme S subunit